VTRRSCTVGLLAAAVLAAACDKDPTRPIIVFERQPCVTSLVDVNTPIGIGFTSRIATSSVGPGSVIVANAITGVEIPGALSTNATRSGDSIYFTPSGPLPFDTPLRIRVQNILAEQDLTPAPLAVCEIRTILPPITQLFWDPLAPAPAVTLTSVNLFGIDSGYVSGSTGPIFRSLGGGPFTTAIDNPYYSSALDMGFYDLSRGYSALFAQRTLSSSLLLTTDGGATTDTVLNFNGVFGRMFALPVGVNNSFLVVGGGRALGLVAFFKYHPESNSFTNQQFLYSGGALTNAPGTVSDVDFAPKDTANGAASTSGLRLGPFDGRGMLFVTSNGGTTWDSIPGSQASANTSTYTGVAIRASANEIFVTGGGGTLRRFDRTGPLAYTPTDYPLSAFGVTNPDPSNPQALVFKDIEFSPIDDKQGWLAGAVQVGFVNGVPQYQGLVFGTTDGGRTWTRQGVRGGEGFGANFSAINHIAVLKTQTTGTPSVWLAGDGGTVLRYKP
jgi:hypothetical protein